MRHDDDYRDVILSLIGLAAAAWLLLGNSEAEAAGKHDKWDFVTTLGMAYKDFESTSLVAHSDCHKVKPVGEIVQNPASQFYGRSDTSCGGDNPAFVGYPIAIEREFRDGAFELRIGWFHQSQWFDAGAELHIDMVSVEATFNWSQMRRNREGL